MADVTISLIGNGPIMVEGPVTLLDADDNPIELEEGKAFFLCRCGQSSEKPFCDGTHKVCGYLSANIASIPNASSAGSEE